MKTEKFGFKEELEEIKKRLGCQEAASWNALQDTLFVNLQLSYLEATLQDLQQEQRSRLGVWRDTQCQ
eukprot:12158084-Prorocentrum_lima.AAC.1